MAITLIVEDGSIVAGANTWINLVDARAFAENIGVTLPTDDEDAKRAIVKGARYVDDQEPQMQGSRVSIDQTLSWPRSGVTSNGFDVPDDSIPNGVICAQIEAAAQIGAGIDPYPVNPGKEVSNEEVVGAVKVGYFQSGKTDSNIELTSALNCLYPYSLIAIGGSNKYSIRVSRG